jgi:hypothetical protein
MMDKLVREITNAENGFRLLFSATPFPGYTTSLYGSGRRLEAIGISLRIMRLRDGFIRRSLNISGLPPKRSMSGQRRGKLGSEYGQRAFAV